MPLPYPAKFEVEILDAAQGKVVRIKGEVVTEEADLLKPYLLEAVRQRPQLVVLDLTDLRFMASAGMGALAAFRRTLTSSRVLGRIAALPDKVKEAFRIAGLTQLYATFETLDEALAAPLPKG